MTMSCDGYGAASSIASAMGAVSQRSTEFTGAARDAKTVQGQSAHTHLQRSIAQAKAVLASANPCEAFS